MDVLSDDKVLYSMKFSSGIEFRHFRGSNFLTKLNSWLIFFTNHKCGIKNIHECEDKRYTKERRPNEQRANERRPAFDENKFLTNCLMVAFDEIFRWRKFPAIQEQTQGCYRYSEFHGAGPIARRVYWPMMNDIRVVPGQYTTWWWTESHTYLADVCAFKSRCVRLRSFLL